MYDRWPKRAMQGEKEFEKKNASLISGKISKIESNKLAGDTHRRCVNCFIVERKTLEKDVTVSSCHMRPSNFQIVDSLHANGIWCRTSSNMVCRINIINFSILTGIKSLLFVHFRDFQSIVRILHRFHFTKNYANKLCHNLWRTIWYFNEISLIWIQYNDILRITCSFIVIWANYLLKIQSNISQTNNVFTYKCKY